MDSIPGKLDALDERVHRLEKAMHETTAAVRDLTIRDSQVATAIAENTAMTKDIKDIVTTMSVINRVGRWLGPVILFIASIIATWKSIKS